MKNSTLNSARAEQINFNLRRVYEQFGYKKYRMNKFEEYSFYMQNKNFLTSDRIITFNDLDGKLMALKPDITLSIAKNTRAATGCNERLYYVENVFRVSGLEFKELSQTGVEFIGKITPYNTIEVITLALKSLAIISDSYILSVSHMGYISALLDEIVPGLYAKNEIISCLKQKRSHDLDEIAARYGLSTQDIEHIKAVVGICGTLETAAKGARALASNEKMTAACDEIEMLCECVAATEYADKIRLDFSTVSSTEYYNGIMFDGYVEGVSRAVIVGGRYDNLIKKMGKSELEAMGFAVNFYELERAFTTRNDVQKQTLVLFKEGADAKKVLECVNALTSQGKSVLVESKKPDGVCFEEIITVE